MTDSVVPDYEAAAPRRISTAMRLSVLALLLVVAGVAAYVFFKTPIGAKLQDRTLVAEWVHAHRMIAPLTLVAVYFVFAVLMLPVWWIQIIAGYVFGLVMGVLWCEVGAVSGAVTSLLLSRALVGEWFQRRYEARMTKLHAFNEKLGHNGLFAVMIIRLCHMLPFGLSNYLFGLTRITVPDVLLGTFAGGLPAIALYVAVGVGKHLLKDWRFWMILGAVNLILLVPLVLRYLKPEWFKRIGVE